jgi:soluble lytic murein transglycosylase-like protein
MMEGIDGIMSRIGEIQDKMRQFCGAAETRDAQAGADDGRDFSAMVGRRAGAVDAIIREKSSRFGLDERLVKSVVAAESNYDPKAVSPKGAAGLMQLMPGTAKDLGVNDVFDPEENVAGGTQYLKQMLDRYGNNLELALAAYNAGPAAVDKAGKIPDFKETQSYVKKVLDLYGGMKEE